MTPRAVIIFLAVSLLTTNTSRAASTEAATATPKTIVELQPFRRTHSIAIKDATGRPGTATLIDLNPQVNAWFLLSLEWSGRSEAVTYHLENPAPQHASLTLDATFPRGIRLDINGRSNDCELWSQPQATALERARRSGLPYAPLCDGRLYLRNRVAGTRTNLERVTDLLRDHIWGGDQIVGFVKQQFFKDAFIEREGRGFAPVAPLNEASALHPRAAAVNAESSPSAIVPESLGIRLEVGNVAGGILPGRWYSAHDAAGIFVSVMQPGAVSATILASNARSVNRLDTVEASALVYLVAMDLGQLDLGFTLGTDHPRVGWSERVLPDVRDLDLPGPDGIDSVAPLVVNGIVNPALVSRTAAAFVGGFKRQHGAFRYGTLAKQNNGSHYGFMEQGIVFSQLQPDLATLFVTDDGRVHMKTWQNADDERLPHIKLARQNGVPLIEDIDPQTGIPKPGSLVNRWGPGNWSGSSEEQLRTLRSGACLQETANRKFLLYGYFSSATPSAMARVFQAYGCRYAMLLDMNALEHTYFAIYTRQGSEIAVQHLITGMAEVDRKGGRGLAPRFLSFPDDRDFFYLIRKAPSP